MDKSWNAPKTKQVNIRLTEYEYQTLKYFSNLNRMSLSHYIRLVLAHTFIKDQSHRKEILNE